MGSVSSLVRKVENKEGKSITFHVPLSFVHDERITSTPTLFIPHDPYAFNGPVAFKFTPKVILCCAFMLRKVRTVDEQTREHISPNAI